MQDEEYQGEGSSEERKGCSRVPVGSLSKPLRDAPEAGESGKPPPAVCDDSGNRKSDEEKCARNRPDVVGYRSQEGADSHVGDHSENTQKIGVIHGWTQIAQRSLPNTQISGEAPF